jgi:hypothetical protein
MSFFSLSPSPDINNLSSSFFNQSNKIRLSIDVVCLVVTSFFSLSLPLFSFFSLKAKMSSTHFIYFTYTTNSPSSPYIYILPSIQSIFIHVRIFQERRKKKRDYNLAEEIFSSTKKKRRSCAFAFLFFLIDKMYKHNEHAYICATNDAKLLNHECTHIRIDSASH